MKNNWVIKYKNIVGVALILLGLFVTVGTAGSLELNNITIGEGLWLIVSGLITGASGLCKNDFHFSVIDCVRGDIVGDVSTYG